jgi:hypothetical protein
MKLQTFTGFRGKAALMQIGKIKFLVLAQNTKHLEALHQHILPNSAEPFNPVACQASIIIQSTVLPKTKPNHE